MSCKYDKEVTYHVDDHDENFSYVGHDKIEVCLRDMETGKILLFKHSQVKQAPIGVGATLEKNLDTRRFGVVKSDRKDFRLKLRALKKEHNQNGIVIYLRRNGCPMEEDFDPHSEPK